MIHHNVLLIFLIKISYLILNDSTYDCFRISVRSAYLSAEKNYSLSTSHFFLIVLIVYIYSLLLFIIISFNIYESNYS